MTFSGPLPPPRLNLARHCLAGKPAEKTALIVAGADGTAGRWRYGALEDMVLRIAGGFTAAGVEPGERVFIRMGNTVGYALVFFAANAIGAIPIPASSLLTVTEVAKLIAIAGARFVMSDGTLPLPVLEGATVFTTDDLARFKASPPRDYADTAADDPGYLIFTSGTSGSPKGVLHANRAIWGRRPLYQGWYGITPDDVMLHTGAFNWTYTLGTGIFDPLVNAATAVVYTGARDIHVWEHLIHEHGATILASVPGLYRQMLKADFKPAGTLRHGLSAGEALAVPLLRHWREATGCEIYEALGMSEVSTYISSSPTTPVKPGSPGKPQPGRSVRLLADGEIAVHRSDPGLMLGYWDEPPLEGEWFATGDTAETDADGYYWARGRIDDMMNAGGFRVSPVEVESVLGQHPQVLEAAVREWRVSDSASIIAGFVVPRDGRAPNEEALLAFVRERLAAYKVPKQIWFLPALPRTANGKLIRKALQKP